MQLTKFGRTGMSVSRLCLGTATFGRQSSRLGDEDEIGEALVRNRSQRLGQERRTVFGVVGIEPCPLEPRRVGEPPSSGDRVGSDDWEQWLSGRLQQAFRRPVTAPFSATAGLTFAIRLAGNLEKRTPPITPPLAASFPYARGTRRRTADRTRRPRVRAPAQI